MNVTIAFPNEELALGGNEFLHQHGTVGQEFK